MTQRISPSPHRPGEVIAGKYALCRVLGEGGMGAVWLAENLLIESQVAIKLLRSDVQIQEAEARFRREARAGARVHHSAVVRVFDYGYAENGDPFIVMEVLEGESLAERIDRRGPLAPVTAVRLLLPILDGLAAVHAQGVVHRDLKPENIFLCQHGNRAQPKLVDFGIAKIETRNTLAGPDLDAPIMGSPSYMAPEQARGHHDVDHRADVWGFCMVLYEAVTGGPPFSGDHYPTVLRRIIEEEVPPIRDNGGSEGALWEILRRGFEKDRERRFQDVRQLGEKLADFLLARGFTDDVAGTSIASAWKPAGTLATRTGERAQNERARASRDCPTRASRSREWTSLVSRRRRVKSFALFAVAGAAALAASVVTIEGTLASQEAAAPRTAIESFDAPPANAREAPEPVAMASTANLGVRAANGGGDPSIAVLPDTSKMPEPARGRTATTKRDSAANDNIWSVSATKLRSLGLKAAY